MGDWVLSKFSPGARSDTWPAPHHPTDLNIQSNLSITDAVYNRNLAIATTCTPRDYLYWYYIHRNEPVYRQQTYLGWRSFCSYIMIVTSSSILTSFASYKDGRYIQVRLYQEKSETARCFVLSPYSLVGLPAPRTALDLYRNSVDQALS